MNKREKKQRIFRYTKSQYFYSDVFFVCVFARFRWCFFVSFFFADCVCMRIKVYFLLRTLKSIGVFFSLRFLSSVHFHRENEFVFFGLFHLITFQYLVDIFQVFSSGIIDSTENHFVLILFLSFRSHSFPLSPLFFDSYFSKSNTHVYICIRFSRMFASMRLSSFSSFPSFIPYLICYHIHFHKYIFYDMCFVVAVVVA